jgi:hypothetical protein
MQILYIEPLACWASLSQVNALWAELMAEKIKKTEISRILTYGFVFIKLPPLSFQVLRQIEKYLKRRVPEKLRPNSTSSGNSKENC